MLSKNKIKYIRSLDLKKNRQKYNSFLVEGEKIIAELLQDGNFEVELLCATPTWIETHQSAVALLKEKLIEVKENELKKISKLKTPNHVLAIAKIPDVKALKSSTETELNLYLDGIQDPGNMGTILRIADWFGIPNVFVSEESADLYNPKVVQASMGAFLRVNYQKIGFEKLLQQLPNIVSFGAVLDGANLFEMTLPKHGLLVIGNEGKGIRASVLEQITHKISIPAAKNGSGAESLNAAVATGIIVSLFKQNS